ncbi:MAG: sensor histidine kinase [Actinomycetota bacterium]|nr:sensor histidine kinase [Actinomycetota bacterium]
MTRSADSLLGQVLAANVVMVVLTILAASLAAGLDLSVQGQRWEFLVLAMAMVLTLCVNMLMLKRRFRPLEHLIERIERVDPAEPAGFGPGHEASEEIDRLARSFRRLLGRIEDERRRSGRLVLRAQEEERWRVARDLHDEVNQALTAILLRLEALACDSPPERADEVAEIKRLANQAMEELIGLARQLRPAALDDHGLVSAVEAQLKLFGARSGVRTSMTARGDAGALDDDRQTTVYRIAQEAMTNAGRHSAAGEVDIQLAIEADGRTEMRIWDDGRGFDPSSSQGHAGLGLSGMAERARLVGGELDIRSAPAAGTSITLRLPP